MDGTSFSVWAVIALVLGLVFAYFTFVLMRNGRTIPRVEGFFGAPVAGTGTPDCLRDSSEASGLIGLFEGRSTTTEAGPEDLRELTLICSKLACMKRDLMAVVGQVSASLHQPFATSHDLEPVAETVGRCLAKAMPARDLELSFDAWKTRGRFLLKRLCTAYGLTPAEHTKADDLFNGLLVDVYDVALQRCVATVSDTADPHQPAPQSPPELKDLGPYSGYY